MITKEEINLNKTARIVGVLFIYESDPDLG